MSLKSTREFVMQEKVGSLRDKVWVMDRDKKKLGYFKGKLIKIGNTFRLYDLPDEDKAILTVSEKVISVRSTYTFYKGDEKDDDKMIGKLKQKLISIKPKYWFENPDEDKVFELKGNFFAYKYKILKDKKEVAEVSKKLFKSIFRDAYGVKIAPDLDDDSAMLVLGIVIMLHHEKEEAKGH